VARTDRAGEAAWSQARPGDATVRAAGFAPAPIPFGAIGTGSEPPAIEVRLEAGRRVSGRVLHADRRPAAGATVSVGRGTVPVAAVFPDARPAGAGPPTYQPADLDPARAKVLATVAADEDGAFAFVDLVAGPYHLSASAPKRVGLLPAAALRTIVSDVASDATDVELVLPADDSPATGRLEGRVVGATADEAAFGVSITLLRGDETVGFAWRPDPDDVGRESSPDVVVVARDGRFAFDRVPVGTVSLEVKARGWLAQRVDGIEVRVGATTTMPPVVMRRGAVVRGTLRAAGVTSWRGRHLRLEPVGGASAGSHTVAVAEDGTYRATGLPPGTYRVAVPAGGFDRRNPPMLPRGAGTVVVSGESGETAFDVDLVLAGMISFAPADPRLPPPPWEESRPPTEEQAKFGRATRVRVTAAYGTVHLDHAGAHQKGLLGHSGTLTLLPGRYVARIEYPGGESLDEPIALEPGPTVFVSFRRP
jgi:hypothetical protein